MRRAFVLPSFTKASPYILRVACLKEERTRKDKGNWIIIYVTSSQIKMNNNLSKQLLLIS